MQATPLNILQFCKFNNHSFSQLKSDPKKALQKSKATYIEKLQQQQDKPLIQFLKAQ